MRSRRQYLRATGLIGSLCVAGCVGQSNSKDSAPTTNAQTTTSPADRTETPGSVDPRELFVDTAGSNSNPGTEDAPLRHIQAAIELADPGDVVRVNPGEYREGFRSVRSGRANAPITISGPTDAVIRPPRAEPSSGGISISHSHIHLTGMTLDGLGNPDRPEESESYARFVVRSRPPTWEDSYPDYLTGVKIMPNRIGNAGAKLIATSRVNNLEIGTFQLIGPAGAMWYKGGRSGYVLGEVVSMGRSSNNFGTKAYPWEGPDQSHDIHIHHIANLAGHRHTELVKVHGGMYDVTVEYCTDNGGFGRAEGRGSSISMNGAQSTARWCRITNGRGNGVSISVLGSAERDDVHDQFATIEGPRYPGRNNAVYGNAFSELAGHPVAIDGPPELDGYQQQRLICGNEVDENVDERITRSCPESIPKKDVIGHLGGDSPWA